MKILTRISEDLDKEFCYSVDPYENLWPDMTRIRQGSGHNVILILRCESNETKRDTRFVLLQYLTETFVSLCSERYYGQNLA